MEELVVFHCSLECFPRRHIIVDNGVVLNDAAVGEGGGSKSKIRHAS